MKGHDFSSSEYLLNHVYFPKVSRQTLFKKKLYLVLIKTIVKEKKIKSKNRGSLKHFYPKPKILDILRKLSKGPSEEKSWIF